MGGVLGFAGARGVLKNHFDDLWKFRKNLPKIHGVLAYIPYWTIPIIGSQSSRKPSGNIGDILLDVPGKWHKNEAQYHRNHHPKSGILQ